MSYEWQAPFHVMWHCGSAGHLSTDVTFVNCLDSGCRCMGCAPAVGFTRRGARHARFLFSERLPNSLHSLVSTAWTCVGCQQACALKFSPISRGEDGYFSHTKAGPGGACLTENWLHKKACSTWIWDYFFTLRVYRWLFMRMMYTITRGPSKLVTQRRTGETLNGNFQLCYTFTDPSSYCFQVFYFFSLFNQMWAFSYF